MPSNISSAIPTPETDAVAGAPATDLHPAENHDEKQYKSTDLKTQTQALSPIHKSTFMQCFEKTFRLFWVHQHRSYRRLNPV